MVKKAGIGGVARFVNFSDTMPAAERSASLLEFPPLADS
jgi:hypothetical protein